MQSRQRIVILGGGLGAVAAAFELTREPGWQQQTEITLYQMGHRLGGKGASGRNAEHCQRIEEHGLHIFLGFYDEAFRLVRDTYEALARPAGHPLASWRDAFRPHNECVVTEKIGERWEPWILRFPLVEGIPGDPRPALEPSDYLLAGLHRLGAALAASFDATSPVLAALGRRLGALLAWLERRAARATSASSPAARVATLRRVARVLGRARDELRRLAGRSLETHTPTRRAFVLLDLAATCARGSLADGVLEHGPEAIDAEDLRAWLRRHGAARLSVDSPFVRGFYDLAFAFEGGDLERPSVSAGVALNCICRVVLDYRGAIMWKMTTGMGDAIFAPLYEVLRRRGVRFEFFHAVTDLAVSSDGCAIDTVALDRQVTVRDGEYRPLIEVDGTPCWPSEPLWDQLVEQEELRRLAVNLESPGSGWPGVEARTLRRGVDFDAVVLGISVAGLRSITGQLAEASPRWRDMLDHVATVRTQALQLWCDEDLAGVGWTSPPPVLDAFEDPFNSWADMSHLLPSEGWSGAHAPKMLAYFCGPLADGPDGPHDLPGPLEAARALASVRAQAAEWMDAHLPALWPAARASDGGFDWRVLHDPDGRHGRQRLDAQYTRANVDPSERYVLSLPGTARYRLAPDDAGFDNLVLAGDWTRTALNVGCAEAAVSSGILAARALRARSTRAHRTRGVGMPLAHPFVSRPPFVLDATARFFALPARSERLAAALPPGIELAPGFERTMVWAAVDYGAVVSLADPSGLVHAYRELVIAAVVRERAAVSKGPGLCPLALYLDSDAAAAIGRECYGFPKMLAEVHFGEEGSVAVRRAGLPPGQRGLVAPMELVRGSWRRPAARLEFGLDALLRHSAGPLAALGAATAGTRAVVRYYNHHVLPLAGATPIDRVLEVPLTITAVRRVAALREGRFTITPSALDPIYELAPGQAPVLEASWGVEAELTFRLDEAHVLGAHDALALRRTPARTARERVPQVGL